MPRCDMSLIHLSSLCGCGSSRLSLGLDYIFDNYGPPAARAWRDFVGDCLAEPAKAEEAARSQDDNNIRKDFFHYLFRYEDPDTGELVLSSKER